MAADGGCTAEAAVADGRDPGGEALGGAEPGDVDHIVEGEALLALDVDPDPLGEVERPVAKPRVDGVLEVRVAVDEAGEDRCAVVVRPASELRGGADGGDAAALDHDCAVLDWGTRDREDPVRREDVHGCAGQRSRSEPVLPSASIEGFSSLPVTEFLNSRIPPPTARPISGNRFEPNTSSTTTTRMISSIGPTFGIGPSVPSSLCGSGVGPAMPPAVESVTKDAQFRLVLTEKGHTNLALLELKDLHVCLDDGTEIVKGVDLSISPNEVHAVMGPNGSGKSTLAYALMGHPSYEITGGSIVFDGEDVTELGADERAQRGLFLAFQYPHAIPGVTVTSFLRSAINAIRKAKAGGTDDPVPIPEFRTELLAAMDRLKVSRELASRYINDGFSGGEKKRVEILQMAMLKPRIAVLDETDSGLDIDALRVVAEGVSALVGPDMGALLITHYQRILNYIKPDFVHVFVDGRIVEEGGPELAHRLEAEGYEAFAPAAAVESEA